MKQGSFELAGGLYRLSLGRRASLNFRQYESPATFSEARFAEALAGWPKASKQVVPGMLKFAVLQARVDSFSRKRLFAS